MTNIEVLTICINIDNFLSAVFDLGQRLFFSLCKTEELPYSSVSSYNR